MTGDGRRVFSITLVSSATGERLLAVPERAQGSESRGLDIPWDRVLNADPWSNERAEPIRHRVATVSSAPKARVDLPPSQTHADAVHRSL